MAQSRSPAHLSQVSFSTGRILVNKAGPYEQFVKWQCWSIAITGCILCSKVDSCQQREQLSKIRL